MESKSTPSTNPTKGTSTIQPLPLYYRWLRLKLFVCLQKLWQRCHIYYRWLRSKLCLQKLWLRSKPCLQKLWQRRPHPLTFIQRQWHTISLVILYIFFRPTFETHIAPLFSQFDPSFISTCFWYGIIIVGIVYTIILIRRKYVLSEKVLLWALVILLGWWYYRFKGIPNYEVTKIPAEWTPQYISNIDLLYIDLLLVIGGCIIVVQVFSWARPLGSYLYRPWKRKQANRDAGIEGFIPDYPASPEDADLLGRSNEVLDLAKKIFHTDTSKAAFTLGLTAPWGAGKTSFMLAMQKHLRENYRKEIILIEFNPWMYRRAPNLTQVFFEELSRTLAPYSSALASGFMQYVDYILSKENNTWIQLGARLLPQGFKAKSTSEQYEFLNKEIGKLGKKIIIFIDDVDRLDSEELTELFCLVRNISSFPNMSYILAYDKDYVTNQLQGKFDTQKNRYIEKILQEEYLLAKITPAQLYKALNEYLKRIGHVNLFSTIKASQINLEEHLPTIRSIKRVCNSILSLPQELNGNIELFDWFTLELIRIQYPKLFEFLKNNYMTAFIHQPNGHVITQINSTDPADLYATTQGAIDFGTYLHENQKSLELEKPGSILKLMGYLWERDREKKPKQVNDDKYIGIYFYRTLQEGDIRAAEFHQYLTLPIDDTQRPLMKRIQPYMDRIYTYPQWPSFCEMAWQQDIKDIKETVNMLYVAFYIITLNGEIELENEIKINNWINQIYEWREYEDATQILLRIFESRENHKGILLYISSVLNRYAPISIPLSQEELERLKEKLFLEYTQDGTSINPITSYRLWIQCQTYLKREPDGSSSRQRDPVKSSHRMNERMRKIIEKNIVRLIPYFIQEPISWPQKSGYRLLLPYPMWTLMQEEEPNEIKNFPKFIFELDGSSSTIIKEFQDFLAKWIEYIGRLKTYLTTPGKDTLYSTLTEMDQYGIRGLRQENPEILLQLANNPQKFLQLLRHRAIYEIGFIHFDFKNITPQDIQQVSLAEVSPQKSSSIEF